MFIRMDSDERRVVDSRPFQRLRHIHQLALTYLVYPGATHRRFEHSLGVMELAGRVFDVVTSQDNLTDAIRKAFPEVKERSKRDYWRLAVRMAALCHDLGHLPFSHAAEKQLLPKGWTHERLTREFVSSPEMQDLWSTMTPPLRPDDIVKLALGKKEAPDLDFSDWETILSEIIVGDAFGVDRIDYLLRDAYHSGVAYGKFDHYRLIDTLRILQASPTKGGTEGSREPKVASEDFPVLTRDGRIASSLALSTVLNRIPVYPVGTVFVAPESMKDAREWLNREREAIIVPKEEPDGA